MKSKEKIQIRQTFLRVLSILIVLFVGLFFLSLSTGLLSLPFKEVVKTLSGNGSPRQELLLYDFRFPRLLVAILTGATLGIAGCILQGITQNPLADTGMIGLNAGAGMSVMVFVSFFSTTFEQHVFLLPIVAMVGTFLSALFVFLIAYKKREGLGTNRLILSGVAVSAGMTACMILLTIKLSPSKYEFMSSWLAGSIWGSNWTFVYSFVPWLLLTLPIIFFKAKILDLFSLGEEAVKGLGVNVQKEQVIFLLLTVCLTGVAVSVSGSISFIGLLVPRLAGQFVGKRHRYLLPLSAMMGSILLMAADILGRVIILPAEMPAGILVSVIGAPYFVYLLLKK